MPEEKTKDAGERFVGFESIPLEITVKVGEARCRLGQLAALEVGQVILVDRLVGEPFDLLAGEVLLARVEAVGGDNGCAFKVIQISEAQDDPRG